MPDRTRCPRCGKIGFVRHENVIKAGRAERHHYCGACTHSWRTAAESPRRASPPPPTPSED